MPRLRTLATVLGSAALVASCGDDRSGSTKTATVAPTTTTPSTTRDLASCRTATTRALDLLRAFGNESRGIVAPNVEDYRRRARAIVRDAEKADCPISGAIESQLARFLQ